MARLLPTLDFYRTAERPDLRLWIRDANGNLIDFTGYTFVLKVGTIGQVADFTKNSGLTGAAGSGVEPTGTPNVIITWTAGDLDGVAAGGYDWQIRATTAGADRLYQGKLNLGDVIL